MFFSVKLTSATYYTDKDDSETKNVSLYIQTMNFKKIGDSVAKNDKCHFV